MADTGFHRTEFGTSVVAGTAETVLALSGELDIATTGQVRAAVDDLRRDGTSRILIDLRPLEFMDCQGPRVLLDLRSGSDTDGGTLTLVPGRRAVQRVFDLTDTSRHFLWNGAH
jgi:anti-anti-sigma factor